MNFLSKFFFTNITFPIYYDLNNIFFSAWHATAEISVCIYSAAGIIRLYLQIVQVTNCQVRGALANE